MKGKKIFSSLLALVLAVGTVTIPTVITTDGGNIGIVAEAADNAAPKNFKAEAGNKSVTLTWDKVSGASEYDVMYSLAGKNHYEFYKTVKDTTCTVSGLTNGTSYDFLVQVKGSNVCSIAEKITPQNFTVSGDFVTLKDKNGFVYITEYTGKGGAVVIPDGYSVVGGVFKGNKDITSVTFGKDAVSVGKEAFKDCNNLKKVVFNGIACVDESAFQDCTYLKTVEFKNGFYKGIGPYAFYRCQSLEKVTIKQTTTEKFVISGNAFASCFSLKSINIPSECTDIYGCAFLNCFSLEKVTIPSTTKIHDDDNNSCAFGYCYGTKTYNDSIDRNFVTVVADGKTAIYSPSQIEFDYMKYTPKKLTMTVTKGSSAEKYAKNNKIAYKYASSSKTSDKLAAPAGFKASKSATKITLKWDAVDGADAYRVYMYNSKTGKYEKCKTVKSAKCTISGLKKGTQYKFKVVALDTVNGKYKAGNTSKSVAVTTKTK
ncbi:MAG: leucine-rich repeat protein [Oscillospiraceae bacterium]|nr:leucine-rich repeat protein [Oscillospiraceae bacterium]